MLGVFKDKLLEEDEFAGILAHIKFKTPDKNNPNHANNHNIDSDEIYNSA
jgi:hypothetical protein